tara:strand:- start:135124 stop:135456 length:333 start_codon:yes stop_codon:yes gene_type:complete
MMTWTPAAVFSAQFISTLIIGMLIPLIFAFQWWRKTTPATIPYIQCGILAALSLFFMFVFPMPVIGMGIAYLGGTPGASIGVTAGWALVAIVFWPTLKFLFNFLKKRKRT